MKVCVYNLLQYQNNNAHVSSSVTHSFIVETAKHSLDRNFATLAENHEAIIKIKDQYKVWTIRRKIRFGLFKGLIL